MRSVNDTGDKPLAEQVAAYLKEYIVENGLKSGDKIPTEKELSITLGAARSTVREAIRSLVSQNILTVRQGSGAFVADKVGVADDPLGLFFIEDKEKLTLDLMEVRMMVEPEIAMMAAQRATEEDIKELEQLYLSMEREMMAGYDYLEIDLQFHQKIAQCSGNLVVPNLIPLIQEAVRLMTEETHRILLQETLDTHRDMYEAIRDHDAIRARDTMRLHMFYNFKEMREMQRKKKGLGYNTPKVPKELSERGSLPKRPKEQE